MKLYLIVANGKRKGLPIPIKADLFLLGSDKVCQLRSQLPGVGKQHCALITREDFRKAFVQDLDSGEPTLLNGELVPPGGQWPLHAGDRLAVGPLEFVLQFTEKQLSQRDLEEWALRSLDVDAQKKEEPTLDDDLSPAKPKPTTASAAAEAILDKLAIRRGIVKGRLRIGLEGGITVVRFNDIYLVEEAEVDLVKKELYENLNKPNLRILLDFKNIRRMSSSAAEMVLELHGWLRPWGSTLALCRIKQELRSVLSTLHILDQIRLFDAKPPALAAKW